MYKLIIVLTVICIVSSLMLGVTYNLTKKKINLQEQKTENEALDIVLPDANKFDKKNGYYEAYDNKGKLLGYALIGEGQGYSSTIRLMLGVDLKGDIKGIKILSQQETPGLGDRIAKPVVKGTIWDLLKGKKIKKEDPWFLKQFTQKDLKDVQTITGSTISSKAVIDIVKKEMKKVKKLSK